MSYQSNRVKRIKRNRVIEDVLWFVACVAVTTLCLFILCVTIGA